MLEQIFAGIDARHYHEPCTDPSAIEALEDLQGHRLPDDVKAFYRRHKTGRLCAGEYGATYRFVPVSDIHPTRTDVDGEDTDEYWGPRTWLTVCDVLDGNYIAIDIASKREGDCNYINCFHETFGRPGESKIIARSFTKKRSG
jgi:cell wall assembly regulator SMI1